MSVIPALRAAAEMAEAISATGEATIGLFLLPGGITIHAKDGAKSVVERIGWDRIEAAKGPVIIRSIERAVGALSGMEG